MNGKKTARVILDVALTAMIVAEMFIQFTGVFLHEVIGFVFFATVTAHLALSAKWVGNTASMVKKGRMTSRRTALAVVGSLLAADMVVLGVSSVAISSILEGAGFVWTLGSYATWSAIHAVSSYVLCALVSVHLAMHWAFLASAFRIPYDPSRRKAINTGVHAVAAVGALALGAMAVNQAVPIAGTSGNGGDSDGNPTNNSGNSAGDNADNSATAPARDSETLGSPDAAQEGSSSSSSSSDTSQSVRGKGKAKGSSSHASSSSAATNDADASAQSDEAPTAPSEGTGTSAASGICTLCRKQCPLSAPKCDKPYLEGLL